MLFQFRQSQGRSGVARHHDDFCVLLNEYVGNLEAVALNGAGTFSAVWDARRVAEVKNLFVRQQIAQRLDNGQAANSGIKNTDRPFVHLIGIAGCGDTRDRCQKTESEEISDHLHAPQRHGVAACPQADCIAGFVARKQRPQPESQSRKRLVIMRSTDASLRYG